jgi:hypothetical protein
VAQTSSIVTLAAATTLVAVVVREAHLGDIGRRSIEASLHIEAIQLRCATSTTFIVLHSKKVLRALYVVSSEGYVEHHLIAMIVSGGSHTHTVNDTVRKLEKSQLYIMNKIIEVGVIEDNGVGGESLVQPGLEGQREGLRAQCFNLVDSLDTNLLNLIFEVLKQVIPNIQDIIAIWAHALGAIHIAIGCITYTATNFASIPSTIIEGLGIRNKVLVSVVVPGSGEPHVLDVLTGAVTRAIVGASSTLAAFAFISIKALAFSSFTVTDTTVGAFGILME